MKRRWLTKNIFKRLAGLRVQAAVRERSRLVHVMLGHGLRIKSWNSKSIKEEEAHEAQETHDHREE